MASFTPAPAEPARHIERAQQIASRLEEFPEVSTVRLHFSDRGVGAQVHDRLGFTKSRIMVPPHAWQEKSVDELVDYIYSEFLTHIDQADNPEQADSPDPTGEPDPAEVSDRTPTYTKEQRAEAKAKAEKTLWGAPTDDPSVLMLRLLLRDALMGVYLSTTPGRRQALAVTHLEEALMWATKAYYEKD